MSDSGALKHFPIGSSQWLEHVSHAKPGIAPFPDRLHVVTMLENPLRWRSRYNNFAAFEAQCAKAGAILYTAEVAFGGRDFEVTEAGNPRHLQLRTDSEIWHKENALNCMIQRLPQDAEYVAWIDADVMFARADWAQETMHLLQHYEVLQMFSHAQDVGPHFEPLGMRQGFMYRYTEDLGQTEDPGFHGGHKGQADGSGYGYGYGSSPEGKKGTYWFPGLAWAARRSALDDLGMLIDFAILGAGDWYMASALVGQVERSFFPGASETYKRYLLEWQARAERYIRRNVGYLPGTVTHLFHGRKADRGYDTRWKLLAQTGYDPEKDVKRDWQGLYTLTERSIELRDGIRRYARARNEDSHCV